MPSITLSNPEDKAAVKRFLSSPDTRIITATVARLYIAYPDPHHWTYADILGAVALIQTSNTFYLRIVDLLYGKGVVWEQELYQGFIYTKDRPFFHSFQADDYVVGLSFADDHEADVFFSKVHGRASLRPFKPVPSSGVLAKSGKAGGAQGRNRIPLHNGKLDKTRIGLPSDFRHVGHIGWDPDVGFDAQNIDPAWRTLFEQLDNFGVSRQQINDNATFITDFVNAHGGPPVDLDHKDMSRIDSPPPLLARPLSPTQRPPPPPPPILKTSTSAPVVSPAPFHGYLPRPLAQVMASLSFGTSSFYGSSSPTGSSPTESASPALPPPVSRVGSPPPPPPPPMPPPLPSLASSQSPPPVSGTLPKALSLQTMNLSKPGPIQSPVEGSLLASIRESGGLQGLRKTGGLRSPPPPSERRPLDSGGPGGSQGDLVSALVAALHQRQTKVAYSDGEESSDDGWDVDD